MKRIIWMGIGVTIGVIAVHKINNTRATLGPQGLNRAAAMVADGLYEFADAVRAGMDQREGELRSALGIDAQDSARG